MKIFNHSKEGGIDLYTAKSKKTTIRTTFSMGIELRDRLHLLQRVLGMRSMHAVLKLTVNFFIEKNHLEEPIRILNEIKPATADLSAHLKKEMKRLELKSGRRSSR